MNKMLSRHRLRLLHAPSPAAISLRPGRQLWLRTLRRQVLHVRLVKVALASKLVPQANP